MLMKKLLFIVTLILMLPISTYSENTNEVYFAKEELANLRVDTVILSDGAMARYTTIAKVKITNIGSKTMNGGLRCANGRNSNASGNIQLGWPSFYFGVNLAPGESKTFETKFNPSSSDFGGSLNLMLYTLDNSVTPCLLYSKSFMFESPRLLACNTRFTVYDRNGSAGIQQVSNATDKSLTDEPHLNTGTVAIDWNYEYLENFDMLDHCVLDINRLYDGNFYWIDSAELFHEIKKGDVKTGTVVPKTILEPGKYSLSLCYAVEYSPYAPIINTDDLFYFYVDDPTGISNVDADAESLPVYSIGGVRVADAHNLPKGIYVRGGKKFVVR